MSGGRLWMPDHPPIDPMLALSALRASGTATQSDLDAALQDVRASVNSGQSWTSILSGAHHDVLLSSRTASVPFAAESIRRAASGGPPLSAPAVSLGPLRVDATRPRLGSIRTLPAAASHPLAPPWRRAPP